MSSRRTAAKNICASPREHLPAPNGRIVEPNLLGDYRWKPGIKYNVVYNINAAEVISLPAHWDPSATVIGMAGAACSLTLWGWCLRNSWRRRRAGPAAGSD
jgi:hypothetical protein